MVDLNQVLQVSDFFRSKQTKKVGGGLLWFTKFRCRKRSGKFNKKCIVGVIICDNAMQSIICIKEQDIC